MIRACLIGGMFFLAAGWSGAKAIEKGDVVIVAKPAELRVPSGKVGTVAPGDYLSVDEIKDKWLWVKPDGSGQAGWIDSANVVVHADAIEHFNERIKKDPKDAAAYSARASMLQADFQWDKALPDFDAAIRLGMKTPKNYCNRGLLLSLNEKFNEAMADFNECLRLDPKFVEALGYRGMIFEELTQYDKALADFRQAVQLEPDDAGNCNALAMFYASCPEAKYRDGKEAVVLATKACEISRWEMGEYIASLAAAQAENGNFAKAVELGQKALELILDAEKPDMEARLALYKAKKPYRFSPGQK